MNFHDGRDNLVAGAASKRPEARKRKRRSRQNSLLLGTNLGSQRCVHGETLA
jgi:hypothetical protein